jgi:hypothetical protein
MGGLCIHGVAWCGAGLCVAARHMDRVDRLLIASGLNAKLPTMAWHRSG